MAQNKSSKERGTSEKKIGDQRFSNFETDPRYRLPSKRHTKTKLDNRFSRMLKKENEFTAVSKVDRYGRKIKSDTRKKALERLYQAEDEEDEDEEDDEDNSKLAKNIEVEKDHIVRRELEKADASYDPARGGGFSSSDSESESEDDDGDEDEDEGGASLGAQPADMSRFQREQAQVPQGEVTNRIAIVNLDWDHIKSVDLMALFTSFVPAGGRIENVAIYPSEFGKERMEREEREGPPKDIFKSGSDDESEAEDDDSEDESEDDASDDEEVDSDEEVKKDLLAEGDADDFDSNALRMYQLDRLRYYYAVMTCSNKKTAQVLYEMTDGSEYLASSNFLDLRFVPDDTTFDDEPRDECAEVPQGYRPVEFTTDALQHSKVNLTWDMHPEEVVRNEQIKKAFSGSRADIADNDLVAYLGSDSDGEEDVVDPETAEPLLSKKEIARQKMRDAFGLGKADVNVAAKDEPSGDLEVTFTPALLGGEKSRSKAEDAPETTIEIYKRKERERKASRKAAAVAKRNGGASEEPKTIEAQSDAQDDLGFDDPFFAGEETKPKVSKTSQRKEERLKKKAERQAKDEQDVAERAKLGMLLDDDSKNHFNMADVLRAEKAKKGKKNKFSKGKKAAQNDGDAGGAEPEFKLDDSRFGAVLSNHEYAFDPTHTSFKATAAVKKLLEEGRNKRKLAEPDAEVVRDAVQPAKKSRGEDVGLHGLADSIKTRSKR